MSTAWVCLWITVCVCVYVCVCCPAAQRRVIQMCVCKLYALDKSTLSPVFGLLYPNTHPHVVSIRFFFFFFARCTLCCLSPGLFAVHCGERKCSWHLCVWDRLSIRFVSISSLFVHIWPETQIHSVNFCCYVWICRWLHREELWKMCDFRLSGGCWLWGVLNQPWNNAFLYLDLSKIPAAFMSHRFFSVAVKEERIMLVLVITIYI